MDINQIYCGDCLDLMKEIPDHSIDMILCDLPYGTTACKWDTIVPFEPLWKQYKRIAKDNSPIVLTASQPFTSALIMSNIKNYRHSWVWNKKQAGNPFLSTIAPLKVHEDVIIFSNKRPNYYPILHGGVARKKGGSKKDNQITNTKANGYFTHTNKYYPTSILTVSTAAMRGNNQHPTQKPVALFEYLIKTYTNEGDLVLDNCIGSGTTAIACINAGRNFIGIEKDPDYFEIAQNRIKKAKEQTRLF